ncbi:hypothetical protein EDB85DRAFT_1899447 [Lactarius pseudohatsudake]|nr:hypothetical protein EDB85DRAFT_1899447 [Lactarius pseudohatsudake]
MGQGPKVVTWYAVVSGGLRVWGLARSGLVCGGVVGVAGRRGRGWDELASRRVGSREVCARVGVGQWRCRQSGAFAWQGMVEVWQGGEVAQRVTWSVRDDMGKKKKKKKHTSEAELVVVSWGLACRDAWHRSGAFARRGTGEVEGDGAMS